MEVGLVNPIRVGASMGIIISVFDFRCFVHERMYMIVKDLFMQRFPIICICQMIKDCKLYVYTVGDSLG